MTEPAVDYRSLIADEIRWRTENAAIWLLPVCSSLRICLRFHAGASTSAMLAWVDHPGGRLRRRLYGDVLRQMPAAIRACSSRRMLRRV
ncbi:hypothetical protein L842_2533 [Mycobacterium intracellulare MIN_052511_1280]|nr:hypothetical protein L842_2533 [Mycobacterium intracellulare MIN_052511_1280]